ncbi:AP2-like ethylene-responsive transcription factor PLT2 [Hibiscus syriacus]|uniref:AP2-like ethylene-responsive transcription factor PLT2 n=1 Tax=Hibiscus syriacus TaxID=106335 RepID=A0A6A3D1A7_HIBSY|nr:AP2-like ethylene-responsive transcription factor PLT2 [Hibiscus syriacus]
MYRGVTRFITVNVNSAPCMIFFSTSNEHESINRHHQHGRWQARIGRVSGNKDLYLGTFNTEEEAAEVYDIAVIKFRGLNAVTNFDMNLYDVKAILESNSLPIGGAAAKRLKECQALESTRKREEMIDLGSSFQFGSSSSSRLQGYPLMQVTFDRQPQPLQTLQNHEMNSHSNPLGLNNLQHSSQGSQLYNSYIQSNPALLHGLMNMSCSSASVVDNNESGSSGSYSGGYRQETRWGQLKSSVLLRLTTTCLVGAMAAGLLTRFRARIPVFSRCGMTKKTNK